MTLRPLTLTVLEGYVEALSDPEVRRLTGTRTTFPRAQIQDWLSTRVDQHDRADWAITRTSDGAFLGEAVVNDLDPANGSAGFRIWLAGPHLFGRGYGAEATELVVADALDRVGLHRLTLEVFDHNLRARRTYEKCGFVVEGRLRQAHCWDGERHDVLIMGLLRTDRHRPS